MILILVAIFIIGGLEYIALCNKVNGVMFSAAVGAISAITAGYIGYMKGKKHGKKKKA